MGGNFTIPACFAIDFFLMKVTSQTLAVLILSAAASLAQSKGSAEIIAADKAWAAAITTKDFAALEKLLADDLVYSHSTGVVDTKKSYIDSQKSGVQKYISVDHSDPKVQLYGNTAVLTSGLKMHTETKGTEQTASFRLIRVWAKKDGHWQLIAHQTTRLP